MRATASLFRREFAAYFTGPIGYVALFGFLVLTGLQFNLALTLLTDPIRDRQVVFAKFAACFAFYLVLWLPTLAYLPVLLDLHAQWKEVVSFGVILLVAGLLQLVIAFILLVLNGSPWGWLPLGL